MPRGPLTAGERRGNLWQLTRSPLHGCVSPYRLMALLLCQNPGAMETRQARGWTGASPGLAMVGGEQRRLRTLPDHEWEYCGC